MTLSPKHTQSNILIQSNIPTSSNHQYKLVQNNHSVCKRTGFLPNRYPYGAGDAFSPSVDIRSYNGVFLNFSSFLTQFYVIYVSVERNFSRTSYSVRSGHSLGVGISVHIWDNLGMGACLGPRRVVSPWLLIQQQNIVLYLPWFSATVLFIN